ncbi:uncharacterized mitochondrial protein AtMg00310-like [Pyrus communis]|uniref:uncharacterized mitochondrial protein AtMg00310-like n=1 Tax=Pyrus communis TaxID=23211 RepID=UPI0035BF76FD
MPLGIKGIFGHFYDLGSVKARCSCIHKGEGFSKSNGVEQQFLSQAGRKVLIKAVARAVPTYSMNVFRLPTRPCREIDIILAKFWWGNRNKERGIHWVNWEEMGCAKGDGGMRFQNLMDFNTGFLAKQCWRLIPELNSLWARVLKDWYFPHDSVLNSKQRGAGVMGIVKLAGKKGPYYPGD